MSCPTHFTHSAHLPQEFRFDGSPENDVNIISGPQLAKNLRAIAKTLKKEVCTFITGLDICSLTISAEVISADF